MINSMAFVALLYNYSAGSLQPQPHHSTHSLIYHLYLCIYISVLDIKATMVAMAIRAIRFTRTTSPPQGHQGQKATRAFWADWAEWDDWVAVLTLRDIIADKVVALSINHLISDNELLKRDLCHFYLKYETCI